MSLKRYISISLLIAFTVLLTPREWWHECDHHAVENGFHHTQIDQDDCSACDYQIAVWSLPTDCFKGHIPPINYQLNTYWFTFKPNLLINYTLLRGPPVA